MQGEGLESRQFRAEGEGLSPYPHQSRRGRSEPTPTPTPQPGLLAIGAVSHWEGRHVEIPAWALGRVCGWFMIPHLLVINCYHFPSIFTCGDSRGANVYFLIPSNFKAG